MPSFQTLRRHWHCLSLVAACTLNFIQHLSCSARLYVAGCCQRLLLVHTGCALLPMLLAWQGLLVKLVAEMPLHGRRTGWRP